MAFRKRSRSQITRRYKRKTRGKYSRKGRTFKARVTQVLMKKSETKELTVGLENQQLYHNTGVTGYAFVGPVLFNTWNLISQGTGEQQRIGKEIYARGFSLKFWMANKLDRPNVMYRVVVCVLPKTYNNARVTAGSIDIMEGIQAGSAVGNYMILPIDKEKGIRVLYDKIVNLQTGMSGTIAATAANKECHACKKLWIKSKPGSKCVFESNGTQDIVNKPMAVYVIPYDSYGTLTTDNIASVAVVAKLYWKDL